MRAAHPLLLVLTTQLYGAARWGIFVAAQAAVMLVARVSLLGFDKGLLYWLPTRDRAGQATGLRRILVWAMAASVACALLGVLCAGPLAAERGLPQASVPWTWMALGILPQALGEFFSYASVARRRPEVLVVVRDLVLPFTLVGAAIGFHLLGFPDHGLAWAFLLAQCLGAATAFIGFRRQAGGMRAADRSEAVDPAFVQYALPLWAAEGLAVATFRLDALVLAACVEPAMVGVYGVVTQFGNTVRGGRVALDPVVHAVAADMATAPDRQKVRTAFGLASDMVMATQLPLAFAAICFAPLVLPWFGDGFARGELAVIIACVGWTVNGFLGLAGPVVSGYGGSRATLLIGVVTLLVLALALALLVPALGIDGAALAVALAFVTQGVLQCLGMRYVVGSWGISVARLPLLTRGGAAVAAACVTLVMIEPHEPQWWTRSVAVGAFAALFVPAALRVYRRPHEDQTPEVSA